MIYTTGNEKVDAIGKIDFTGNMTPPMWFHTIRGVKGPKYLAILILSDIVYWYRPQEIRDEGSGQVVSFKKKFRGDLLQRSYQQIADQFEISKKQATEAINFLQEIGAIRKVFRTINVGGVVMNNVLFIDIDPERVDELTHPSKKKTKGGGTQEKGIPVPQKGERVSTENVTGYTPECNTLLQKSETGDAENEGSLSPIIVTGVSMEGETNTEISPEITTEISGFSSSGAHTHAMQGYVRIREEDEEEKLARELLEERENKERYLKQQLDYDIQMKHLEYGDKEDFEGFFNLILNTLCTKKKVLRMDGDPVPAEVVKSVFMKLTAEDVLDVMERVRNVRDTEIDNIDGYILTSLYKQRNTMSARVRQKVAYEVFGEGRYAQNDNEGNTSGNDDQHMAFIKSLGERETVGV